MNKYLWTIYRLDKETFNKSSSSPSIRNYTKCVCFAIQLHSIFKSNAQVPLRRMTIVNFEDHYKVVRIDLIQFYCALPCLHIIISWSISFDHMWWLIKNTVVDLYDLSVYLLRLKH